LAAVLHYISFEDFNILSLINFAGILIIYSIRLSIDRESRKIESEKPEFRDEYILKLKKEESQFLEASIISFMVGFALMTIQYSISNPWSWFYQILSILVIPVIEAIAMFSLLFWLIWHFSRTSEEKKRKLIQ
jgi:fructose-specific phosphotransferase system IIC component